MSPPNVIAIASGAHDLHRPRFGGQVFIGAAGDASPSAIRAAGRLMKKIHRQDAYSTRMPPSGGPSMVPIPLQAVHWPTARPLSLP